MWFPISAKLFSKNLALRDKFFWAKKWVRLKNGGLYEAAVVREAKENEGRGIGVL